MFKIVMATAIAVGALALIEPAARAQTSCDTINNNAGAVNSAMNPGATPPIRELSFGDPDQYANLGPPGPYYPERAARMGTGGVAVISCSVGKNGRLSECRVLAETPTCLAFGLAALKMAEAGYVRAKPSHDAVSGDSARFVVVFPRLRR